MTGTDPAAILEVMHAVLDEDPSDIVTRLVVADLLEDQGGRAGARGQRWQAGHGKWPALVLKPVLPGRWRWWDAAYSGQILPGRWRWWDAAYSGQNEPDDIPSEVFRLLPGREKAPVACHYPTRRAAEADLAQALESLAVRDAVLAGHDGDPCPWCGGRKQVSSGRDHACDGCGRRWES